MPRSNRTTTLSLHPDAEAQLRDLAEVTGRGRSRIVEDLIARRHAELELEAARFGQLRHLLGLAASSGDAGATTTFLQSALAVVDQLNPSSTRGLDVAAANAPPG